MWTLILISVLCSVLGFYFYKWATKNNDFFKDKGVVAMKPTFLLGNSGEIFYKKISMPDSVKEWYNKFPDEKIFGMFSFTRPVFVVRDLELMKTICVKDFDHFTDHMNASLNEKIDPLLGNMLISLQGKKWKAMRNSLTPAFTGSKMRQMFSLVNHCFDTAMKSLKADAIDPEKNTFEMKELMSKFSVDIIASCAFGLETDTYKNPENDFKKIADKTMNPNVFLNIVKFVFIYFFPKLMKKLNITIFDQHTKTFFQKTITDAMSYREANNIVRPDMIHLLMQVKRGDLKLDDGASDSTEEKVAHWSNEEIIAQCLLFFLAGFDTSSSALSVAAYELAVNPDIQETLRREIAELDENLDDRQVTYDDIQSMKYLDRFVMEVLRKWPPAPAFERGCVKDYTFDLDGRTAKIPANSGLFFTIYAYHHDPKNFENPDKFDPDRFNEENIGKQNMSAYVPFGVGPRSCIGNRFALMNIKTILYKMMQQFSFEVCEKTQIPLQYKKTLVNVSMEKGVWIRLKCLDD